MSREDAGRAAFYIDLLADRGPLLGEPYTRQLRGELRELRFSLPSGHHRITCALLGQQRIVLFTVFRKTARRAPGEIGRAEQAVQRCLAEGHTADDGG